jgi:hypothetical protein
MLLVVEVSSMGAMCDFISIVVYSAAVLSVQTDPNVLVLAGDT